MKQTRLQLQLACLFLILPPLSYGQGVLTSNSNAVGEKTNVSNSPSGLFVTVPLAYGKSKFLGCEWNYNQASGFEALWNQSTPENAGKWGSVEGTRNSMYWKDLDSTYNVAKRSDILFKQHTMIWGTQQPNWMASLDSASQRQEIEQWFAAVAARYPDIDYIDVVNEPIHCAPNGMIPSGSTVKNIDYVKALGGSGETGWDWVITAFKLARQYFPKSKLILNEYSVISSESTTQKIIQIVNLLKADSLIDGIGEQAHAGTTKGQSVSAMKANLDALAATGIPLYITEMDIDGSTDQAQLSEMQRVFTLFWEHPAMAGITFWGFRNGMWRSSEKAYLITPEGVERPALKWLKAYVNGTLTAMSSVTVTSNSGITTMKKGETLNMIANVLPANTTFPEVTWTVVPSYLATINSEGLLTATATKGTVTVTASSCDGSNVKGTLTITIEGDPEDPENPNDTTDLQDQNSLFLKEKAGTQTSFALNKISKITFSSGNMVITKMDGVQVVYGLSSIQNLHFSSLSTSLKTLKKQKNSLTFYPNPVSEQLTICYETTSVSKSQIKIFNLQGKILYQQTENSNEGLNNVVLPVSQLPKGMYVCRIVNGKKSESIKFYKN